MYATSTLRVEGERVKTGASAVLLATDPSIGDDDRGSGVRNARAGDKADPRADVHPTRPPLPLRTVRIEKSSKRIASETN
jgi:hypothetical protein